MQPPKISSNPVLSAALEGEERVQAVLLPAATFPALSTGRGAEQHPRPQAWPVALLWVPGSVFWGYC